MFAGEGTHILDDSCHAQKTATCHVSCANRNFLCRNGGCGDDDQIGARQHARETHLYVAGAGRHVDEEIVEVAPVHIVQELFDRLGEHEATPHEGRAFVFDEHPGGHDFQQSVSDTTFVGNDHRLVVAIDALGLQAVGYAEHARNRESPDVGIEHTDRGAAGCESCGEVDRDGTLADTTLAACDCEDARVDGNLCVGRVLACVPAGAVHHGRTFGSGHFAPVDDDLGDVRVHLETGFDVFLQLCSQGAALDGELETHVDDALVGDRYIAHHAQVDHVVAEFRVDHGPKQVAHRVGRRQTSRRVFVRCAFHDPNVSVSFFA